MSDPERSDVRLRAGHRCDCLWQHIQPLPLPLVAYLVDGHASWDFGPHVFVWARCGLTAHKITHYGSLRIILDAFHLSDVFVRAASGSLAQIVLNCATPLVASLHEPLALAHVAVSLDKIFPIFLTFDLVSVCHCTIFLIVLTSMLVLPYNERTTAYVNGGNIVCRP